jgi:predicted NBD/HSP70 family sugar kinase
VHIINDASMQALASYEGGRMLFVGLGTSIGATLIVDDTVIPLEMGMLRLTRSRGFADAICKAALDAEGKKRWEKSVWKVIALLRDCFWPDEVVIGGGNAKILESLPAGVRIGNNQDAFRGALRLWPGADMRAEHLTTTWRITRRKEAKPKKK